MNTELTTKILILLFSLTFRCQSDLVPPGANNVTGTKASNYARLREHILQRPAALHKIPPDIESGFLKTFPISFQIVLVSVSKIDEINQVMTIFPVLVFFLLNDIWLPLHQELNISD